jgi:hypothetical protein
MKKIACWSVAALVVAAVALWLLAPAPLYRDPPRDLPWQLPDYRAARTHWEVAADGRIHASVEHFFLRDITPAMIAWFYRVLPISTVELDGTTLPLYHIFHPTEHGRIRVLDAAPGGEPGMATGATVYREEWFGPHDSRGAALLREFSDAGMLAIPTAAGIAIGEVRHSFRARDGGTHYRVDAIIGADLPLFGSLLNLYLRKRVFHPAMMSQWQRHQIEEVASLQFFLPQLYAQREMGNHFILHTTP